MAKSFSTPVRATEQTVVPDEHTEDTPDAPRPGIRPGEGTSNGRRRLTSGGIIDWRRYAVGMAMPEVAHGIDYAPLWAGEWCSVVNDIKTTAQIVADLVRDARAGLHKLG